MLIKTQNKMGMVKAIEIHVAAEFASKKQHVFAKYAANMFFSASEVHIATYESAEEVKAEFDEMAKYFAANPNGVYEMR